MTLSRNIGTLFLNNVDYLTNYFLKRVDTRALSENNANVFYATQMISRMNVTLLLKGPFHRLWYVLKFVIKCFILINVKHLLKKAPIKNQE